MNILFVNHNSDLYGASRSLLRLAGRLQRDGHEVHVVLPDDGPLTTRLREEGITCHRMPDLAVVDRTSFKGWARRFAFIRRCCVAPFQLARLIHRIKPDLLHTNVSVILASGLAAKMTGCPHVLHVREFYDEFKRAWPLYRRYLCWSSDRIICVSQAVALQFGRAPKVSVLHNGFPSAEFPPASAERVEAFRSALGVSRETMLVGLPGRVKLLRKGQETFMEACATIASKHPAACFVIIGSPFPGNEHHLEQLKVMATRLHLSDRVTFFGECLDMQAAYAALDVVVMASGQPEPFGGTVIEAMAMGRVVIGTNIGGTPEQIVDGATGLLVPPNDPGAMAMAMDRLLRDTGERNRMGLAGRKRYEAAFEFEHFYRHLQDIYSNAIQTR